MEPGFLKPGNAQHRAQRRLRHLASMEPGFLKPGNIM